MKALKAIRDKGFIVTLAGEHFEIIPASELTQTQREFLKSHRAEILAELRTETANDNPLMVTVWTPAGNPMTVQAQDAEHAAFLIRMNPKPKAQGSASCVI